MPASPTFLRAARRAACLIAACFAVLATSSVLLAQLPTTRLSSVFPPSGKQGTEVEVTITGTDLEGADKLIFTHLGITAAVKMREPTEFELGPQAVENTFVVKIAGEVPVGRYEVRASGKYGLSNSRVFLVGDLAEAVETEPNNAVEQATPLVVDSSISGRSNGGADIDLFKITAKQGQRLIIDCQGERIDSRIDATLVLTDAAGKQLELSRDVLGKDPLIDFTAPADGEYRLKLYDFIYGGGNEHVYRVSVSSRPHLDYVIPSVGQPGATGAFTLYGRNLPGGVDAGVSIDGKPLQKLDVQIPVPADRTAGLDVAERLPSQSATTDGFAYRLAGPNGSSNPLLIGFAQAPVVLETEPNNDGEQPQQIAVPCELTGQFQTARDVDWFTFTCKANDVFWFEMTAGRHGSPTDPYLLIQQITINDKGEKTYGGPLDADDGIVEVGGPAFRTASDDTVYRFVAPAEGAYRVMLRDLYYRGGPQFVYRLSVRPEQLDFRLVVTPRFPINDPNQTNVWSPVLRKGGVADMNVYALRRDGFNGDVLVSVEGLPAGVTCAPVTLGPNQQAAPLVFAAADDVKAWSGPIKVIGKATIAGQEVAREARGGAAVWEGQGVPAPARMTEQICLSVTELEIEPWTVTFGEGQPLEMSRAGKLEIPVKVTRREGGDQNIALQPFYVVNNLQLGGVQLNQGTNEAKATLTIPNNVPVGTYTFNFQANGQVAYKRGADLIPKYEAEFKHVEKLAMDLAAASTKAAEDAKKAGDDKTAADTALQTAQTALKTAQDGLAAAQKLAAEKPDDQAAKDALAVAQKAAEDAQKALDEATLKAQQAAEAKTKADADAAAAVQKMQAADAAKAAAEKKFNDLKNAGPQNINVFRPTTSVTLKVTEAPVVFAAAFAAAAVKQGAAVDVPVGFTRLYGYADPVQLEVMLPGGLAGVKIDNVAIPQGANDGKLVVQAAADATPGDHKLTVRATVNYNGQNVQITQELPLKIEAAAAQ